MDACMLTLGSLSEISSKYKIVEYKACNLNDNINEFMNKEREHITAPSLVLNMFSKDAALGFLHSLLYTFRVTKDCQMSRNTLAMIFELTNRTKVKRCFTVFLVFRSREKKAYDKGKLEY